MTRLALLVALAAACSKPKHLPECDSFRATIDKLATCASLPPAAKDELARATKQLDDVFKMLDEAGGIEKAPADLRDTLRDTCKAQNGAITEAYQKLAPDCMK